MEMIIPGTKLKNNLIYVGIMLDEKEGHYHLLAKNKDEEGLFTWSAAVKPRGKFVCPTSKELNLMRTIAEELGMTEFYRSSTEHTNGDAWVQGFSDGFQGRDSKDASYRLRCVRRVDDSTLQALLGGESKEELISKVEQIFKEALAKLEEL